MRVVYYADDGTEFESEKECREYEDETADLLTEFTNHIHAYDKYGNAINLSEYDPTNWEDAFQEIEYIKFDTKKAIDCFLDYAIRMFGLCDIAYGIKRDVIPDERYFYDWDNDKWECLDDKLNELDKIANVFIKE